MYEHGCLKVNVVSPMDRIRGGMLGPLTPFKFKPSKHPAADYAAGSTTAPGVRVSSVSPQDVAELMRKHRTSPLSGYTPGPVE